MQTYTPAEGIDVITSSFPIPGYGFVPVNAFVLDGPEPILVDTGTIIESADFQAALRSVVDPMALRWIWLTHTDADHIGSLHWLLDQNPQLRVITTFLGVGIMSLQAPLPMDRVNFVNPGQSVTLGDRTLTAFRPPVFDNPCTTGFYEHRSGALFSSDCFGALLADPPQDAGDISERDLREGQVLWATIDSPWLHKADAGALARELKAIERMQPRLVLSSHLPAAAGTMTGRLLQSLAEAPGAQPFVGPDQAALEEMLKQMTEVPQPA